MTIGFRHAFAPALLCVLLAIADSTFAQSAESVFDLDFKKGEKEIDLKIGTVNEKGSDRPQGRQSDAEFGVGFAPSDFWFTQGSVEYQRESGSGGRVDSFEWENRFRLAEAGSWPVDVGLLAEIDWFRDRSEGVDLKIGPLLQKEIGNLKLNANLLFERHFRGAVSRPTDFGYQLQVRYRLREQFEAGAQAFGDFGPWPHRAPRSEQSHRFGPAVFGKFRTGQGEMQYNAAYLVDPSQRARSYGLRGELSYRF